MLITHNFDKENTNTKTNTKKKAPVNDENKDPRFTNFINVVADVKSYATSMEQTEVINIKCIENNLN